MKQPIFNKQKLFLNRQRHSGYEQNKVLKRSSFQYCRAQEGHNRAQQDVRHSSISSQQKKTHFPGIGNAFHQIKTLVRCSSILPIKKNLYIRNKQDREEIDSFSNNIPLLQKQNLQNQLYSEESKTLKMNIYDSRTKKGRDYSLPKNLSRQQMHQQIKIPLKVLNTRKNNQQIIEDSLSVSKVVLEEYLLSKKTKMAIWQLKTLSIYPLQSKQLSTQPVFSLAINNENDQKHMTQFSEKLKVTATKIQQSAIKLLTLDMKIRQKEKIISYLTENQEKLAIKIQTNESHLANLSKQIESNTTFLQAVTQESEDMKSFIESQPNRILQTQAKGYKQKQEELFEMACLFSQTNQSNIPSLISESTLASRQAFIQALKFFQFDTETTCIMLDQKKLKEIKRSLLASHQHIIQVLSTKFDAQSSKIRQFSQTIRQLASYTQGKREYLDEINEKMTITSALANDHISKLKEIIKKIDMEDFSGKKMENNLEVVGLLEKIEELCGRMRRTYNEAQVFY